MDPITSTATASGLLSAFSSPQIASALHSLIVNALQLAALGIAALVAYGLKLWTNSLKYSWQRALATKFVRFAQQRLESNPEKLAFVKAKLKEVLPSLSDDEIEHLVESAVIELKSDLGTVQTNISSTVTTSTTPPS